MPSQSAAGPPASPSRAGSPSLEPLQRIPELTVAPQRLPRSLPPWIGSYDPRLGDTADDQLRLLSSSIPASCLPKACPPTSVAQPDAHLAPQRRRSHDGYLGWTDEACDIAEAGKRQVFAIPWLNNGGRAAKPGRKWDHLRSSEPVIVTGYAPGTLTGAELGAHSGRGGMPLTTAWNEFLHSSHYGRGSTGNRSEIVSQSVLDKLQPTFNLPVESRIPEETTAIALERSRAGFFLIAFQRRMWRMLLHHSFSSLFLRLTIIISVLTEGALAARLLAVTDAGGAPGRTRSQAAFAVGIDLLALPCLGYLAWDEFTGKPLGLRSAKQKILLILLDLIFIILKSGSVALAFDNLVFAAPLLSHVPCALLSAMTAFVLVGLLAWSLTFMVNLFKTVEQLGGGGGGKEEAL